MDSNQDSKVDIIDDLNDLIIYGDENLFHIDSEHGFPAPMLSLVFYFNTDENKKKAKLKRFIEDTRYHYPDYDIMDLDTVEVSTFAQEVEETVDGKLQRDIGVTKISVLNCTMANYTMTFDVKAMIDWALTITGYYKELVKDTEE